MKKILILGASGFLGSALEHRMKAEGHFVVSVARKLPPYRKSVADEFNLLDLSNDSSFHGYFHRTTFDQCYQLASSTGGLGYIGTGAHDAEILINSLKINLNVLEAIRKTQACDKIFFASSQCVYPDVYEVDPFAQERVYTDGSRPCRESDARFEGSMAFGKEKLYAEALYDSYRRNHNLDIRIGRLGNTYGAYCTWDGERAKSVAAICRKVAQAPYSGFVKLWGSGQQTRSFTYVDDAVEGMMRLMASDCHEPVNLASSETVTIVELFHTICKVAGKILAWEPEPGPVGVNARGSDNTLCRKVLGWEPAISLAEGISQTYPWIAKQALTKQQV